VWDEPDRPEASMLFGKPDGSAVPLVWAHAEYLKLLRSATDGKVFDRIDAVYHRYSGQEGRKQLRRDLEIYSLQRPIQKLPRGATLRILNGTRFEITWSADGWQTVKKTESQSFGCAGYSADIAPPEDAGMLVWTMHWPDQGGWLGYNVEVKIEGT
jgi:glucoamylase